VKSPNISCLKAYATYCNGRRLDACSKNRESVAAYKQDEDGAHVPKHVGEAHLVFVVTKNVH